MVSKPFFWSLWILMGAVAVGGCGSTETNSSLPMAAVSTPASSSVEVPIRQDPPPLPVATPTALPATPLPATPQPTSSPRPIASPQTTPLPTATPIPATTSPGNSLAQQVIERVNRERSQRGLVALSPNPKLERAAQIHAQDMVNRGFFSHTGSDGSSIQTRVERQGYAWSALGENIAKGQTSPDQVMASWMASPGHRNNILNPSYREIGVAYLEQGHHWVQVLGTPR